VGNANTTVTATKKKVKMPPLWFLKRLLLMILIIEESWEKGEK
jgi:hypothetical protein